MNFDQQYGSVVEELIQQGLLVPDKDIVRMTKKGLFFRRHCSREVYFGVEMAKTFEYSMKIPFDMSDVNGYIKIPQLILLSLQVSGMQSIELGMSDMYILENYNLVWIITDYNMKIERLPVFDEKITIETYAKSHNRLFCYRAFNIKDEAGNTIIEMVATFVLMDRDTRKVHPVMSEITDAFDSEFSKTMLRGPCFKELEGAWNKNTEFGFTTWI